MPPMAMEWLQRWNFIERARLERQLWEAFERGEDLDVRGMREHVYGPHALEAPRRLEIMRDSRNGTFGVLALALTVLIKVACLAQFGGATGLVVLIGAHAISRAAIAYPLLAFSPVHTDGLGAQAGKPTDNDVWLTIGIGAAVAFLLLLGKGFFAVVLAPLAALAAAWFAARWIAERIGGYTGDTLGAVQQKAETVFLVVAALTIGN